MASPETLHEGLGRFYGLLPLVLILVNALAQCHWRRAATVENLQQGGSQLFTGWGFSVRSATQPLGRWEYVYLSWDSVLIQGRFFSFAGYRVEARQEGALLILELTAATWWRRLAQLLKLRAARSIIQVPVPEEASEPVEKYVDWIQREPRLPWTPRRRWKTVLPGGGPA